MKVMGAIMGILFFIIAVSGGISFFSMNPFATVICIAAILLFSLTLYLSQFVQE